MKAICTDGLVIDCGNFKAIDGGVVLTEDVKRKRPIGFVPLAELRYVVPDDTVSDDEGRGEKGNERGVVPSRAQRRDVTRLRDRLDRLEAAIELSRTHDADTVERPTDERDERTIGGSGTGSTDLTTDSTNEETTVSDRTEGEGEDEGKDENSTDEEPESKDENVSKGDARGELQRIDGLGLTYATRLREAGIETLDDLAAADDETIAAAADVGETRANGWIEQARES